MSLPKTVISTLIYQYYVCRKLLGVKKWSALKNIPGGRGEAVEAPINVTSQLEGGATGRSSCDVKVGSLSLGDMLWLRAIGMSDIHQT